VGKKRNRIPVEDGVWGKGKGSFAEKRKQSTTGSEQQHLKLVASLNKKILSTRKEIG